jgi:hypothetical protein
MRTPVMQLGLSQLSGKTFVKTSVIMRASLILEGEPNIPVMNQEQAWKLYKDAVEEGKAAG